MFRKSALFLTLLTAASAHAQLGLALKNGDRVVFYGDSITDGAWYPKYAELFVRLRYPNVDVKFYNAGVGGDRVTGGWMGPIDDRMTRDLFSRKPTVITVMLGMNDGSYQAPKDDITNTYKKGYQHMVDRIKKEAPTARVFLIKPSPFDDVTRAPGWPGGYNGVMKTFSDFVGDLAKANGFASVDFNAPVVAMLEKANATDPAGAAKIIPDRVHPGPAGHMVMVEQLLLSWGGTPIISMATLDASPTGQAMGIHAQITNFTKGSTLGWDQLDEGLPFPIDRKNPEVALALKSGDFDKKLNLQTLVVKNLEPGDYALSIDGKAIATFTATDLAQGVNLAEYMNTPMFAQAQGVWNIMNARADMMYNKWRQLEFSLGWDNSPKRTAAIKALEELSDELDGRARAAAKPVKHHFELKKASS